MENLITLIFPSFETNMVEFVILWQTIKLMNYNESHFYHANPYYKQDYLPDRAWYNRQEKSFPSQMPSGKDFLPKIGRRHFMNKFNHSEIQNASILKSPQRFPCENRIALNKNYMRNLNTIDIEGASSNTRVNQAVRNRFRAQEQQNLRFNQSLDLKEKTQELKRRQIAQEYYQAMCEQQQKRKQRKQTGNESRISNHPNRERIELKHNPQVKQMFLNKDLSDEYKRYIMLNSSNKFHKNIPIVKPDSQFSTSNSYNQHNQTLDSTRQLKKYQEYPFPAPEGSTLTPNLANIRKSNPTNLSINLAGQSIVAN